VSYVTFVAIFLLTIGASVGISTTTASAHEKWFVDDAAAYPIQVDPEGLGRSLVSLSVGAAAVGAAYVLERLWRKRRTPPIPESVAKSQQDLKRLFAWMPVILAVHAAVPLVAAGVQRELFVPNLLLSRTFLGGVVALVEIVIALGFVYGILTRPAAMALAALFPIGAAVYGPAPVLEHVHLLGIAFFLFVLGRGPYSFDGLTDVPKPRVRALIPSAVPVLRVLTGLSIAWLGLTEKLWNVPLGVAFLTRHPLNFMPALGFTNFSDADFVVAAGIVEVVLGLLIVSGFLTRLVILAAWIPFNLSLPFLGWGELIGHLPTYGIMAVLLLWGSGRDARVYQRELADQAEGA
jgi:uncharacterized membrane protein YphA (DoxX/SURF4 family)